MKIVTYNLRGDFGIDGINDFACRQPLIARKLLSEQPDIIGFQEAMPHMTAWLRETLCGYCLAGCGRSEELTGEAMVIAFRADRFTLIEMRTFWLSPTPNLPGSRYPDQSSCPRTATILLLLEQATGKVLRVINTHLDHEGPQARRLGLEQLLRHIDEASLLPDAPVILMGDFNAEPDSAELAPIMTHSQYIHASKEAGLTFHAFGQLEKPVCIDYIFLKGVAQCLSAGKWQDIDNGVYLSDHDPVWAEIQLD